MEVWVFTRGNLRAVGLSRCLNQRHSTTPTQYQSDTLPCPDGLQSHFINIQNIHIIQNKRGDPSVPPSERIKRERVNLIKRTPTVWRQGLMACEFCTLQPACHVAPSQRAGRCPGHTQPLTSSVTSSMQDTDMLAASNEGATSFPFFLFLFLFFSTFSILNFPFYSFEKGSL